VDRLNSRRGTSKQGGVLAGVDIEHDGACELREEVGPLGRKEGIEKKEEEVLYDVAVPRIP